MPIFYRIQPSGLGISNHRSQSSESVWEGKNPAGVDVFSSVLSTLHTDVPPEFYGDEVIIVRASRSWDNGDVEGERINGTRAKIEARFSWRDWLELLRPFSGAPEGAKYTGSGEWETASEVFELTDVEAKKADRAIAQNLSRKKQAIR